MHRDRRTALLVGTFAALSCGQPRPPAAAVELQPHACTLENLSGYQCATYPVWENRQTRRGRKIGLNIVILPATRDRLAPDAVFILAGGPGQAATSMIPVFARNTALRAGHVLVFIDQRGAGGSHPLDCDFYGD